MNDPIVSMTKDWIENVTQARIDDYRRVIATFKTATAVAYDNIAPRAMLALDDPVIAELIALYDRCEHEGRWPDSWRYATMVMMPKAEEAYRWRLIAMLCTTYRI